MTVRPGMPRSSRYRDIADHGAVPQVTFTDPLCNGVAFQQRVLPGGDVARIGAQFGSFNFPKRLI